MTISSNPGYNDYTCNGSTVDFPFTFKVFADDELRVFVRNKNTGLPTDLALNTDYTVSGAGNGSGGTVTTVAIWSSDYTLHIRDNQTIEQQLDLRNQTRYSPDSVETAFDRLAIVQREQQKILDRCIKIADGDTSGASVELEYPDGGLDSKNLTFDSNGNVTASGPVDDAIAVSAAMEPVVGAATLAAGRAAMGPWEDVRNVGTQPQAGENVGIWSNVSYSGGVAGRSGQFWDTYSGSYAATAVDARHLIDGSNNQDHGLSLQAISYANGTFTGTINEFNVIYAGGQWNSASGTATAGRELYLGGFIGTNPERITNKWGVYQASPSSTNRFFGRVRVVNTVLVGGHDARQYLGIARFAASDKYSYINAGLSEAGTAQPDTGLRFSVRDSGASQVIPLSLESNGKARFYFNIGFNGASPIAKPTLPANCTDLPTAISLLNSIRVALIDYGLCQ